MHRYTAGGLAVAWSLVAGVTWAEAPKSAEAAKSTESSSWYDRMLGKKAEQKPENPAEPPPTPRRPSVIVAPLSPEVLSAAVQEEQSACARRLDVCAQLREVALAKNDEAMLRQIDEVEKQAIELCQARVARMGVRVPPMRERSPQSRILAAPPISTGSDGRHRRNTMTKCAIWGILLAAGVGCVHIKPIGPLASMQSPPPGTGPAGEGTPEPILREAPPPTPPAVYVSPNEITAATAADSLKRLTQELETDRRTMDAMPRYAEISIVK